MPTNKGNDITVQIKLSVKIHTKTKNPYLINAFIVFVLPVYKGQKWKKYIRNQYASHNLQL